MSDSAQATDRTSSSSTLSAVVLATSTVADLFSDDTQSTLIGSFATFADALAAASDDNAIVVTDPGAVGNVGAVTVDVENLTVIAASPFYANFSLGQNIVEFTLGGTTDSDIIGTSQPILRKNIITGSDGGNVITHPCPAVTRLTQAAATISSMGRTDRTLSTAAAATTA